MWHARREPAARGGLHQAGGRRLLADDQAQPEQWITRAFLLGLSRPPTEAERAASLQFLDAQNERRMARDTTLAPPEVRLQSLADFCQALFSLNEFIYVD